jgi:hypothetical protein
MAENILNNFPFPPVVEWPCQKRTGTHWQSGVAGQTVESTGTDP